MAEPIRWLALGYSVPVNPSKNRVYIWRKLKEYGAEYFKQGVAILPYNRQSYTKLKHLQAKILEMGGEASIVEMKFLDPKDEREMVSRFRKQALEELSQLKEDCAQVLEQLRRGEQAFTEDQSEQVKRMILRCYSIWKNKEVLPRDWDKIRQYSRKNQVGRLLEYLAGQEALKQH